MKEISLILAGLTLALSAHAAGARRPTPPLPYPDATKTALHCGELYLVTAPDLFDWKGEIRGNCFYTNYCYTHGHLDLDVDVPANDPDNVHVRFSGSAKRIMDLCGHLFCEKVRVGRGWYRGELILPLKDISGAKFASYKYHTRDIFSPGHSSADRTNDSPNCQWKAPWNVIDIHARSGD